MASVFNHLSAYLTAVLLLMTEPVLLRTQQPDSTQFYPASVPSSGIAAPVSGNPRSEQLDAIPPASLNFAQIVERMRQHDKAQTEALKSYKSIRHYEVEYHGFFKKINAQMDVEIDYAAASGKSFRVITESGSHAFCSMVLKRALDSELEASHIKEATSLTETNYRFRLLGNDSINGRPAYVLEVKPIKPSKFLYEGKIWVDSSEFALEKLEVQPAKNPSFWISRTVIHHTYAPTDGFWLPQKNRSETRVRIGGRAVMTIDYGTYRIVPR